MLLKRFDVLLKSFLQKFLSRIISANPLLKARFEQHELITRNLALRMDNVEILTHKINYELSAKPFVADETKLLSFLESNGSRIGFKTENRSEFAYSDFENLYRGTEDFILTRMRYYQQFFQAKDKVLDVGCGRGELLQVLEEIGVNAFGIEPDKSMYEIAKSNNLKVEATNWQDKFNKIESDSYDAIVLIQVIEHLDPSAFSEFFTEAHRILASKGKLIVETVNPHSPAALKTFWLDLTHTRPIFPESLIDLAIRSKFDSAYIVFPYGNSDWEHDIRYSGEYTAIIQK